MKENNVKAGKKGGRYIKNFIYEYSFILVLLVILVIYSLVVSNRGYTFNWNHIAAILSSTTGAVVGIIALGMAFIIITGQIDLSVGSMLVLVGSFSVIVYNITESILLTVLFAVAAGALCGFINGALVGWGKMPPFIVTLGTMLIYRSIAEYCVTIINIDYTGSSYKYQLLDTAAGYDVLRTIGSGRISIGGITIPYITLVFLVLVAIMVYISSYTKYGKRVYAIGSNEKASRLTGINVDWIKISVFVICGILTGIASLIQAWKNTSITPASSGTSYEMYAIAAVVLGGVSMSGGKGKVIGILFGALSYATIDRIISASGLDIYIQGTFQGIVLILVVLVQTLAPVISGKIKTMKQSRKNEKLIQNMEE
ncbi:ABC transporter permease [Clostridium sp. Marseille-P3244]|uniref:ABC transporter permease n=1 Tax=Clostridium sp. Marseille-P3244 TaxID=1871020 RepID=UPI00092FF607|nr:ABC transporter permease [Clostridium sp. Marseille-P3244]